MLGNIVVYLFLVIILVIVVAGGSLSWQATRREASEGDPPIPRDEAATGSGAAVRGRL